MTTLEFHGWVRRRLEFGGYKGAWGLGIEGGLKIGVGLVDTELVLSIVAGVDGSLVGCMLEVMTRLHLYFGSFVGFVGPFVRLILEG